MSKLEYRVDGREVRRYFTALSDHLMDTAVSTGSGQSLDLGEADNQLMALARVTHAAGNKLIFVGNGGSAAIASHMAADYSKNGNIRALALNDVSMLTCLGNDLGFETIFAKQIELHARTGDLVIAISGSGRSANMLEVVQAARAAACAVVTFSGFTSDNPLRGLGDINFYINSDRYGFVEIAHLTICHAILDFICGLRVPEEMVPAGAAA
jgi:D-sedoheptulose 7-phosphate isomerase